MYVGWVCTSGYRLLASQEGKYPAAWLKTVVEFFLLPPLLEAPFLSAFWIFLSERWRAMLGIRIIRGGGVSDQNSNIGNVCLISVFFFFLETVGSVGLPPAEGQTGSMVVRRAFWKGVHFIFIKVWVLSVKKALFCSYCVLLCFINKCFIFYGKSKLANVFSLLPWPLSKQDGSPLLSLEAEAEAAGGRIVLKGDSQKEEGEKKYYSSRFPEEEGEKEVSILHKVQDWKVLLKQKEK